MKTTEKLFRESIDHYNLLIIAAENLNKKMATLSPNDILHCCHKLQKQQKQQAKTDLFIIDVMLDSGPDILQETYIGEYQRILQKAIHQCDELAVKAKEIRSILQEETPNSHLN